MSNHPYIYYICVMELLLFIKQEEEGEESEL